MFKVRDEKRTEAEHHLERVGALESALESMQTARSELERELVTLRELTSTQQQETARLTSQLEAASARAEQLEAERRASGGGSSDLERLLDAARRDALAHESLAAAAREQLETARREATRAAEQLAGAQEREQAAREAERAALARCEQLASTATEATAGREAAEREARAERQRATEERARAATLLTECQQRAAAAEQRAREARVTLEQERRARRDEADEWQRFQQDLLMTVRVANDFKTEAQQELQQLVIENKQLRDRLRTQQQHADKLKNNTGM